MKEQPTYRPPRWAERLLEWYCRPELLEDLQGDLIEYFNRNVQEKGIRAARLVFVVDVIKFFRPYTVKQPKISHPMHNLTVLRNYFKSAARSLGKNKLFSTINILGMAISMSVGLLLIAFVADLKHFDAFHAGYDRIYRVINTWREPGEEPGQFASTSILAGKRIRESAPGIEEAVIINRGFNRDLSVEGKKLPIKGLWASENFFRVFSFELLSGNPETALKTPYSIVLSETAARKLFNSADATGKTVDIDTTRYTVTGVVRDPPRNSHIQFEMLGSLITMDNRMQAAQDKHWLSWTNMWNNYVYLLLPEQGDPEAVQRQLQVIADQENKPGDKVTIDMHLQPLSKVVIGPSLSNELGFHIQELLILVLTGLAFVVIVSACFNYTNLSVARALRRSREVGIRKVVGASRGQVFLQFLVESVLIATLAVVFGYLMFLVIRPGFLGIDAHFSDHVTLRPALQTYLYFVFLAVGVGILAGIFPALFFSRIDPVKVIKDISQLKLFRHVNVRKVLITFQFALSICFMVAVGIGYKQYSYSLNFDLGFNTHNILNINMQGNSPELLKREVGELPEVTGISASMMIPSVGETYSATVKYQDPMDSTYLYFNNVDENYIPLHEHELIAGRNFRPAVADSTDDREIIVNEKTLQRFGLGSPLEAVGKELAIEGEKVQIIGVIRDFHHGKLDEPIRYFAFRRNPEQLRYLNLQIASADMPATVSRLQAAWKKIDAVHPFEARFYDEEIQRAYAELSAIIKIIGFLAFLAISIASLGLLGMVVFTTETRLKEISIRKVLGATEGRLIFLLSRGFLYLLIAAGAVAIPLTWLLFDRVLFADIVYRAPIGFIELFSGALAVIGIALLAISSQTIRVARANPAETLGRE